MDHKDLCIKLGDLCSGHGRCSRPGGCPGNAVVAELFYEVTQCAPPSAPEIVARMKDVIGHCDMACQAADEAFYALGLLIQHYTEPEDMISPVGESMSVHDRSPSP